MAGGLIGKIVLGIAGLVIGIIIAFVVISNVSLVDNDLAVAIAGNVINESGRINSTAYTLTKASESGFVLGTLTATNTTSGLAISSGNWTVSSGVITNATAVTWPTVMFTYSYTYTPTVASADNMIGNFSAGINEVSEKIPTVLIIAVVVLILGILSLMWQQYKKMSIGGGSEL